MEQHCFQASAWYHAVTLTERLASLRAVQCPKWNRGVDAALAARRMQRWQSQAPFATGSAFAQRLAMDGMTEDELLYLLGEPVEAIRDQFTTPPPWLEELARAFFRPFSAALTPLPEALRAQQIAGFLGVIEPLITHGRGRMREGVQTLLRLHAVPPFDPSTVEELLWENLPWRLIPMVSRTLVLELQVARLQGRLHGDTPQERFHDFCKHLREHDTILALLRNIQSWPANS